MQGAYKEEKSNKMNITLNNIHMKKIHFKLQFFSKFQLQKQIAILLILIGSWTRTLKIKQKFLLVIT